MRFARLDASAASHTPTAAKTGFRILAPALGIVAPPALQGAALEKDGGPDARPVVDGVFLDVEDVSADPAL